MKTKKILYSKICNFIYLSLIFIFIMLSAGCSDTGSGGGSANEGDEDPTNTNSENPLLLVLGGTFTIGDINASGSPNEEQVTFSYSFYVSKYEVSQKEYNSLVGSNPSTSTTNEDTNLTDSVNYPVTNVDWSDAIAFCNLKSQAAGLADAYDGSGNLLDSTGTITTDITKVKGYRLLTEAEWEYIARNKGARDGELPSGDTQANIGLVAWYSTNSGGTVNQVGTKNANELAIHDMTGNVWEWCHDWYGATYPSGPLTNPIGPGTGTFRILRGGSYITTGTFPGELQTSTRSANTPNSANNDYGIRIARTNN